MRLLVLLPIAACTAQDAGRPRPRPTDAAPTTSSSTTAPGDTGTSSTAVFDCATVPAQPASITWLDGPRAYNDMVFDVDGALIGHDQTSGTFIRSTSDLAASPWAPYPATVYKMDRLPGEDFVALTSDDTLIRVTPDGAVQTVLDGMDGYGLAVGADGMVYAATNYTAGVPGIVRIDPDTGDWELVIDLSFDPPRAIAFGRDPYTLYIGTQLGGTIYRVRFDADFAPLGDPEPVAMTPDGWHDTLEVDACGNLYVGSFFGFAMFRVQPDQTVTEWLHWNDRVDYAHGLAWGDPAGGWDERAVYLAHPYLGSVISEVQAGVPGASWPGEVIGGGEL